MDLITMIIIGVGIIQLPLLVDMAKTMFPRLGLGRWSVIRCLS